MCRRHSIISVCLLLAACSADTGPGAPVASVEIMPGTAQLPINATLQLTAVPRDSRGATLNGRSVTWSSGSPSRATVTSNGLVTALSLGPVMITATSEGVAGTANVTVMPGPATQLSFGVEPTGGTAGIGFTPDVEVVVRDAQGDTASGFTGSVSLAIGSGPAGSTLIGTTTVPTAGGVAVFPGVSVSRSGTGYTLVATSPTLASATSTAFAVAPGAATRLAFTGQPGTVVAGAPITPPVEITVQDAYGNTVDTYSGTVTVGIAANPAGGTLSGTLARSALAGIASFTDLNIDKAGVGYSLRATSDTLTVGTSAAFDVTPGGVSAAQSAVVAAPAAIEACTGSCSAGAGTAALVTVTAKDVRGNVIPGATVTLTVTGVNNTASPAGSQATGANGTATWTVSSTAAEVKNVTATIDGVVINQAPSITVNAQTAVSAGQSTVSAVPTSLTACLAGCSVGGGTASLVSVTARDQFGNPIPGTTVALNATGSNNTLTAPGTTDASGVATSTFSSSTAESKTISATLGGQLINATASVTVNASTTASATLSTAGAAPTTVTACSTGCSTGASSASLITVTARDPGGNPIQGATVVLGATGSNNSFTAPGTTNAIGVATSTFSSTTAEAKTITVTINGTQINAQPTVTVNAQAAVSASQSTLSAVPSSISACPAGCSVGGGTASLVSVTAKDQFGNPIPNVGVALSASGSNNIFTVPGTTGASGVATSTFSSSTAEPKTISATLGGQLINATASVTVSASTTASATLSTAGAAPTPITACSTGCSTGANTASFITVTAKDAGGNPIAGATVALSATGSNNNFTPPPTTNASGVSTSTFTSTTAEAKTITVTINGTQINAQPAVTVNAQTAVSASLSTVGAAPATITACSTGCSTGASTASLVTVTAKDQFGNPILGASVVLSATGSNNNFTTSGATNASGVATATFTSTSAEAKTISATLGGVPVNQTAGVTVSAQTAVSANLSTIGAAPTSVTACSTGCSPGANSASLVTVTAKDQFGNPIPGTTVVLSSTGSNNNFTAPGTTDASGVATSIFSSSTAESKTISATLGGQLINATASVTVNASTTASATLSTAGAAPTPITACSAGCSTGANTASLITVTAKDAGGNPIAGATVTLSATGSGNSLTPPPTTNASGVSTSTFTSTTAEAKTITVTINGTQITAQPAVTVNAQTVVSASLSTVGAAPATITACNAGCSTGASTASLVTVTAKDQFGNPIQNASVVLSATGSHNSFTAPGATNASGVATATFTSTMAEAKTISATLGGVAVTGTAGVTVNPSTASTSLSTLIVSADTIGQCLNPCDPLKNDATAVTVTAVDQFGNPLAGAAVVLSASPASADSNRFTNPGASGSLDGSGRFTARFNSAQALVDKVISATVGGISFPQTGSVKVMPVLVGAGDISDCTKAGDDSTARLLDSIPGTVFADGDDAYPSGTPIDFTACYDPNWGRHKARTVPVLGNHEYDSSATAAGYFGYYGTAADPLGNGIGYYSFDISTWHIVVLNSEPAGTASNQLTWLQGDLAGTSKRCILALWHEPLFTSGPSGGATQARRLWNALQNVGADLVINGHDHMYERFALQDSLGNADPTGIREIIAGTGGGESHAVFGAIVPNDEANDSGDFSRGVLRLTLYADSYRWEFIPAPGFGTYTDSGTQSCH